MKLLKYLAVIIFILFILVNVLTRLPVVQDRIMMSASVSYTHLTLPTTERV